MSTRASLASAVVYQDPSAALDWLEKAFGFERSMVITDNNGKIEHSEMRFGDGYLMVGSEWDASVASPKTVGGRCTQTIHVQIDSDIDTHCAQAEAAGATILMRPADQFYGDRVYRAQDPEGHVWTFGQSVRTVSREDAEKASGLNIEGWV
ncbi:MULTISPECIES: VOC family protein [unclassified Mycobacterium]|uniref:VOC family protein n=1 Tax=unclassified Mycobacterium TaxID=2642494 RepID=UPI000993EB92|nr:MULTISPECIES: VOC family protein [unclassified Mycobacterium]